MAWNNKSIYKNMTKHVVKKRQHVRWHQRMKLFFKLFFYVQNRYLFTWHQNTSSAWITLLSFFQKHFLAPQSFHSNFVPLHCPSFDISLILSVPYLSLFLFSSLQSLCLIALSVPISLICELALSVFFVFFQISSLSIS